MDPELAHKRRKKGGSIVHFGPLNMNLLNENPSFRKSFQHVGCLRFYEKL